MSWKRKFTFVYYAADTIIVSKGPHISNVYSNKMFCFCFKNYDFIHFFQPNQFTKVLSIQTALVSDPAIDGTVSSDPVAMRKSGLRIKMQGKLGMKKRTSGVHLTCKVNIVCKLANWNIIWN